MPTYLRSATSCANASFSSSRSMACPPYLMTRILPVKRRMYGSASRSVSALLSTGSTSGVYAVRGAGDNPRPMRSADGRDPMQGTGRGSRRSRRPASNDSCPTRYAAVTRRCLRGAADALTGWLAHFTAFAGGWDERAVSLGIAVLLAAVLPLDWALACACLGRWLGAALVVAVFCPVVYLTMGGYADGWLTLLLLLEVLALAEPATERLGWLAASVVSLLKWEGW